MWTLLRNYLLFTHPHHSRENSTLMEGKEQPCLPSLSPPQQDRPRRMANARRSIHLSQDEDDDLAVGWTDGRADARTPDGWTDALDGGERKRRESEQARAAQSHLQVALLKRVIRSTD